MPRKKKQPETEPEFIAAARAMHLARAELGTFLFRVDPTDKRTDSIALLGDRILSLLEELRRV